jgi:hypothetical protein
MRPSRSPPIAPAALSPVSGTRPRCRRRWAISRAFVAVKGSTQVANSLSVDVVNRVITVVFDDTSNPRISALQQKLFTIDPNALVSGSAISDVAVVLPAFQGDSVTAVFSGDGYALAFFDGARFQEVKGSTAAAGSYVVDPDNKKISVIFDDTSFPRIKDLLGTVFTIALRVR